MIITQVSKLAAIFQLSKFLSPYRVEHRSYLGTLMSILRFQTMTQCVKQKTFFFR